MNAPAVSADSCTPERLIGRYALYREIASGGMATVHLGRLIGPAGFSRVVAIKRMHPHLAKDPEFVTMFLDEARLATRIRHPNVVSTLDVVAVQGEVLLVMDFVLGESLIGLFRLLRAQKQPMPVEIASSILCGVLFGLHAAHEATSERGVPLGIVHRDISPQNIMVGVDGSARVLDFGVAKAAGKVHQTRDGKIKGKLAYMAPEQLKGEPLDRRADIFAASIVLWEALTGVRLFKGDDAGVLVTQILNANVKPPSDVVQGIPPVLNEIVLRGLARDRADRFPSAREMAIALEKTRLVATSREVGEWVEQIAGALIRTRAAGLAEVESDSSWDALVPQVVGGDVEQKPPAGVPRESLIAHEASLEASENSSPGPLSPARDQPPAKGAAVVPQPPLGAPGLLAPAPPAKDVALFGAAPPAKRAGLPAPTPPPKSVELPAPTAPGDPSLSLPEESPGGPPMVAGSGVGYAFPAEDPTEETIEGPTLQRKPAPAPVKSTAARNALLALGVSLALVAGVVVVTLRSGAPPPTTHSALGSEPAPSTSDTALVPSAEPTSQTPPDASAKEARSDTQAAPSASVSARTRPAPVPLVPVKTKPKPDCREKFTIDARGVRVPKPECF